MTERFPGYDVLSKRWTPSWNDQTRKVVDDRLATDPEAHAFFDEPAWRTLKAVCSRIIPQPADRPSPAPLAAMVDEKMATDATDGYRDARMPPMGEAWRRGLTALEAEAQARHGRSFADLHDAEADGLLTAAQEGLLADAAWGGMACDLFFKQRVIPDIVGAYYAHPVAWNEIGFGGPAAPRGYVRLDFDRRDPWEASEASPGREAAALRENRRVGRS
ncbi:MAG TPA: gluconate 2-dehydrogenase subunit 3 family protein [Phenylobacterium sp.]|uniref:gluconate 2-dehydrogenase subunit 3 family protein n=1 Tax=Phenylobacterium sp. TaxID=1871053 RepID=UPI002D5A437E|nr:gluconate 2-dehydrogenase subunit 3 family protein [Phenylobacterium sp.]HZZ70303.1 gluconate 2-dehydrogenase subunit 3 family protein [Phenylobacterium sp.]